MLVNGFLVALVGDIKEKESKKAATESRVNRVTLFIEFPPGQLLTKKTLKLPPPQKENGLVKPESSESSTGAVSLHPRSLV